MSDDFTIRMFTPILWQEKRDARPDEELRPLSFAKLRRLLSCETCESRCGQAA
jgi:hypothetical protein